MAASVSGWQEKGLPPRTSQLSFLRRGVWKQFCTLKLPALGPSWVGKVGVDGRGCGSAAGPGPTGESTAAAAGLGQHSARVSGHASTRLVAPCPRERGGPDLQAVLFPWVTGLCVRVRRETSKCLGSVLGK